MPSGASKCVINLSSHFNESMTLPGLSSPEYVTEWGLIASACLWFQGAHNGDMAGEALSHGEGHTSIQGSSVAPETQFPVLSCLYPWGYPGTGEVTGKTVAISEQTPELILTVPEPHATALVVIVV